MSAVDGWRVALCHEWITTYGGSEQVAQRLAEIVDARDVFTFTARPELAEVLFPGRAVHVSPLGQRRAARDHWQRFLPVMPLAWSRVDLRGFDLVVTSAHACVNAVRVPAGAVRVSYCHTPMRYAWDWRPELGRVPAPLRRVWPVAAAALRRADRRWARHVHVFVANSRFVADRIRRAYGREARVVYPPVDTSFWTPTGEERGDHFLVAGRLVAYKRVEVAIQAATIARVPLVVAGAGPELTRLREMAAGAPVRFVVGPDRDTLRSLYRGARAFLSPGVEDFGMTMVEAQACGTPVIAYGVGGAREAVTDGVTGVLYEDPTPRGLADAMLDLGAERFDTAAVRSHAETFGVDAFDAGIREVLRSTIGHRYESGARVPA